MTSSHVVCGLLAVVLCGCAVTDAPVTLAARSSAMDDATPRAVDSSADGAATSGPPDVRSAQPRQASAGRPAAVAPQGHAAVGTGLAIWHDPAFRARFIESYIAETDVEPRVTEAERDTMRQVLELMSADKADDAVQLLEAQRGPAATAVFDFTLGNIWFQREAFDQAVAAYRVAVDKHPKFRRAWRNLGLIHVRENRFADAVRAFARVIELGGGDAVTYGLLGFGHANLENHVAAESAYRMAALLDPATTDWKMGLARSFFKQERFADAASLCGQMIGEQPDRADLWLLQANAYVGLGQPMKAAENFELVDRMGQSTAESLAVLGDIYVNEEIYELAVDAYVRALEKDPSKDAARAIRSAKVLASRGVLDGTVRLVERIEALAGTDLDVAQRKDLLNVRARVAMAEGAGEEEARVLGEMIALDPLDGDALILLGQYYGRAGDVEKATFYFERAGSIDGFEPDAKVRQAQLLVGQSRYAEALPLLRRAQAVKFRENVQEYLEQVERVAQNR